jgi:hypothetical protein
MTILTEPWRITLEQKLAELDAEVVTLRQALRDIAARHDSAEGDAVTVQIARKALGS